MIMNPHDFNIIWIESCAYPSKTGIPKHNHDFFHYIYVVSGEGEIVIANNKYLMSPGNLYLMPPFVEHDFYNKGEGLLCSFEIKFTIDETKMSNSLKELPFCMDVKKYPVKKILSTVFREKVRKFPRHLDIISCEFQLLLTYILRCYEKNSESYMQSIEEKGINYSIDKVIDFVNENLSQDLNLIQLAHVANFEKNYFVRVFKGKTGKTPMIYVRDKRINKAKQLLKFSDMNVTQIAYATGFKTVHYFSKTFLDCTGQRPLDYRKENLITNQCEEGEV